MGSETYIYLDCYGQKLICKASPDTIMKSDTEIEIAFDINKMHFFDKETKLAIASS
jgi:multiple sugar transport system ATP-binding protein